MAHEKLQSIVDRVHGKWLSRRSVVKARHDCDDGWEKAVNIYRGQLQFYVAVLLPCGCINEILRLVKDKIQRTNVPDAFKFGYLLRMMVQSVNSHIQERTRDPDNHDSSLSAHCFNTREAAAAEERLAYFLREILGYRIRNASLLMGISDARVDELLSFAHRRLERIE